MLSCCDQLWLATSPFSIQMRAQQLLCAAAFAAITAAQDVACLVNGVSVATVDLQTGT